ncbi:MAG: DinB family protein [Dehalococcoidia bacterium]|jgi:ADP-ribose pyrophosphatase YjhB (NUDIX family)|nr:DinB family protein [Dehalococcoidia bacterium]
MASSAMPPGGLEGPAGPQIVSAALMLREDGQLLLVQHPPSDPDFAGLWSLPAQPLADDEVAEGAIEALLRERLHVQPGTVEFNDTIYFSGDAGGRFIVNVFSCDGWHGEPRFADEHFQDAAWLLPGAQDSLALIPELAQWLQEALAGVDGGGDGAPFDPETLVASLAIARRELFAAFDATAEATRELPSSPGGWSPVDVIAHVAAVEAYYAAESRRMLEQPGHTWLRFNERQWEDDHRTRPPESEGSALLQLNEVRARTSAWVATLDADQLAAYGNHAERGVVTVGERLDKIARHDREHAGQLASFEAASSRSESPGDGGAHAAADR